MNKTNPPLPAEAGKNGAAGRAAAAGRRGTGRKAVRENAGKYGAAKKGGGL